MFRKDTSHLRDSTDNYTIGGHHTCYVGEILSDRYVVLKKLSLTKYSSVWAAKDIQHSIYVAIKIFRSALNYNELALEELEKLQFMYKGGQEKSWKKRFNSYREKMGLVGPALDSENLCVKLAQQVP